MKPLVICSVPRSRTFWLYKYFGCYEDVLSHHELATKVSSTEEYFDLLGSSEKQVINSDCWSYLTFQWDIKEHAHLVYIRKDIARCAQSTLELFDDENKETHWVNEKGFDFIQSWYKDMHEQYMDEAETIIEYDELDDNIELLHEIASVNYDKHIHRTMKETHLNVDTQLIDFEQMHMWQTGIPRRFPLERYQFRTVTEEERLLQKK